MDTIVRVSPGLRLVASDREVGRNEVVFACVQGLSLPVSALELDLKPALGEDDNQWKGEQHTRAWLS
jgi:phage portal protein BeeE